MFHSTNVIFFRLETIHIIYYLLFKCWWRREEGGGGGQTGTLKVCLLLLNQTFKCIEIPTDSKFLGEKVHKKSSF